MQVVYNGEVCASTMSPGWSWARPRASLPVRDLSSQTMEGLFDQIEAALKQDAVSPGRRNYATAWFDSRDGHPVRYVHRVAGTSKRLEWQIKLTRDARPMIGACLR